MAALSHGDEIDPHRWPYAAIAHGLGEQQRNALRAVIAVMDAPLWRVSPGHRHLQRLVGQLGGDVGARRPARYAPRPYVHHERQIQPALAGLDVGDAREPRRVGAAGLEPALDQVVRRLPLGSALLARGPPGARARDAAPASLPHDAGHALARGAHPERPQPHERLGRAVDAPDLVPDLGYRDGKLLVAHGVRARRARLPGVVALARRLQRRAHLRHRPARLVEGYELELGPLRRGPYSCLPAKKALAFKSISFSRLSRSFSLFSLRRCSAIWNGLASGAGPAASAFLTQSARLPAPQPRPRATSAYVAPDFLYSSTAFCLNSAVYLGDGLPMARLAFLRCGHHAETEIDLSTDLGQIQIQIHLVGHRRGRPAQLAGHPPARPPPLQAVLYRRALGPVQPAVPLLPPLPLHGASFLSGGPCALASGKALSQTQSYMSG